MAMKKIKPRALSMGEVVDRVHTKKKTPVCLIFEDTEAGRFHFYINGLRDLEFVPESEWTAAESWAIRSFQTVLAMLKADGSILNAQVRGPQQ